MSKHALQQVIEDAGWECREYSGRGMNGDKCLGVDVKWHQVGMLIESVINEVALCIHTSDDGVRDTARGFRSFRTDFIGMDTIVYFEDVPYTKEDDNDGGDWAVILDDAHNPKEVYVGNDENEARKVFEAYVGSNTAVSLERNAEIVCHHKDGKVVKARHIGTNKE